MRRSAPLALLALLLSLIAASLPAKAAPVATPSSSHPEMIYFVMLDRFENGDPSNDTGGLTGSETTTGFLPSNPGFYHGGDI